ncbi:MAG: MBL fold metallo-hydrolase [Acidimicrobiales bacterium]
MTLSVTVLGCSGSYAAPGGACSGYLVRAGETAVWVDAGPGTLANLQRHLDLDDLDAVVLSHAHPDHWVDLLPFHNVVRYIKPRTALPVFSPAKVRNLAATVNGALGPAFDWQVVGGRDVTRIGALTFRFSRTDHPGETLAMRVDGDGASLGYSADTGSGWSLAALGPGLGLALCEATIAPEDAGKVQHLTAAQAGADARSAGARELVLTHLQPGVDADRSRADATEAFGAPVGVAAIDDHHEVHP